MFHFEMIQGKTYFLFDMTASVKFGFHSLLNACKCYRIDNVVAVQNNQD